MVTFHCDNEMINRAARIALGDIRSNCIPFQDGLLTEKKVCLMAGLDYDTPWTRDTAINTVNAMAILEPEIAKNTLLSVLEEEGGEIRVGGQYWDKVLWIIAADRYCDITNDTKFQRFALKASEHTLLQMEKEEFDKKDGLFRGPAVYGDGISAYPDRYTRTEGGSSGILEWPAGNPEKRAETGYGIPMKALSTNLAYYEAYLAAAALSEKTGSSTEKAALWREKAAALKNAVNLHFWNEATGRYDYLVDPEGRCDHAEALGLSFAILFGVSDTERTRRIIDNTRISPEGIPVVWPAFPRYQKEEVLPDGAVLKHYGRHSGTVWPHAQGYWALAMRKAGNHKGFDKELWAVTKRAVRDLQFAEIYHPDTGEIYGGLQELRGDMILWKSCSKQTWSATAFLAMLFYGIAGLSYLQGELTSDPYLPEGINEVEFTGLPSSGRHVSLRITRGKNGESRSEIFT